MKDIFNTNKSHDKNEASIIRVIRPGSDDYDMIHNTKKEENITSDYNDIDKNTIDTYNKICSKLISDDIYIDKFIRTYTNIINTNILSGKKISNKAYTLYNLFRSI